MKLKDVGLASDPIAFVTFDVDGYSGEESESGNEEISGVGLVERDKALLSFAELDAEIRGDVETSA